MTSSGFKSNDVSEKVILTENLLWLHIRDVYTLLSNYALPKLVIYLKNQQMGRDEIHILRDTFMAL